MNEILTVLTMAVGAVATGALAWVLFIAPTPTARLGRIEGAAWRGGLTARAAGAVWAAVALVGVIVAENRAPWLVSLVFVAAGALFLPWRSCNHHLGALVLWTVSLLVPVAVGGFSRGPGHDWFVGSGMWAVFALSLLAGIAVTEALWGRGELHLRRLRGALILLGGVGAVALIPLVIGFSAGRVAAGVALGAGLVAAAGALVVPQERWARGGLPARLAAVAAAGTALLAFAAVTTAAVPAAAVASWSLGERLLGFDLPGPWTWSAAFTHWRVDAVFTVLALVLAGGYLWGVRILHRRGDEWPPARTWSWLIGCAVLLYSTASGVNVFSYTHFSVHMALHMVLNLCIPAALVLAGPATLALRVLHAAPKEAPAGPREWITTAVHSRYVHILSQPLVALLIYITTLYGLYFSPLFAQTAGSQWGHIYMNVHFLLAGYLFYWPIIGIDPGVRRLPHLGRVGILFAIMPFHAFFGIATMSLGSALASDFYLQLGLMTMGEIEKDQRTGGMIAWGSGEVPLLAVVLALMAQWFRSDSRTARREDRSADRFKDADLDAYNSMLAEMAEQRR